MSYSGSFAGPSTRTTSSPSASIAARTRVRWIMAELGHVDDRCGAEPLEVAPHKVGERALRVARAVLVGSRDVHRARPERPRTAGRCVDEGRVRPERRPHARPLEHAEPLVEPRLHVGIRAWRAGMGQHLGDECVDVGDGEARGAEPSVEAGFAEPRQHRLVDRRLVAGMDRVEREADRRALDDRTCRERPVEVRRIEALDAVPERDVWRRRFLGLECENPPHGRGNVQRRPIEQELAGEGGAVQRTGR